MMTTKGEAIVSGFAKIQEGLELIARLGNRDDLLKEDKLFSNLVLSMVKARNTWLSPETVTKVVDDLFDVLFDLSKPYRAEEDVKAKLSDLLVEGSAETGQVAE